MKLFTSVLMAGLLLTAATARAEVLAFNGRLTYQDDVGRVDFTLHEDTPLLKIWTDSWQDGRNFDPAVAIWDSKGIFLRSNSDNAGLGPGMGANDSGMWLTNMAAGNYTVTVSWDLNVASSTAEMFGTLAEGGGFYFSPRGEPALWPTCETCDGKGGWQVHLNAPSISAVPEPSAPAMMALAGAALALTRRRRHNP